MCGVRQAPWLPTAIALSALLGVRPAAAATPPVSSWLSSDVVQKTVSLRLVAAYDGSNAGFNFDGYGRGKLLVRVPLGWRVLVTCRNAGAVRHSCAIVLGAQSAAPAFRGAATPNPVRGLQPGKTARFAFVASRAGVYRIACLVPGYEQARMWDVLQVGGVRRPSIETRTGF